MRYVFVIEDNESGGVSVELEGDGIPEGADPSPAGLVAVAVDHTIQNVLGPQFTIEDNPEDTEPPKSQQQT